MLMAFTQNKQQTFSQPVQPTAPEFNDILDVLNPNITRAEKIHGVVTLPFQPVLHPLKTIKGVFETYSKIATIPLAVYSGNLDRVKGIIQGTDDFSGKDVVAQMEGTTKDQVHGIIPSLAGFGLDIAADPFVGVVKAPEEIAKTMNSLTIQAAAPGLPQALNHFGVNAWVSRWFGTGLGRDAKDIQTMLKVNNKSMTPAQMKMIFDEVQANDKAIAEATAQKKSLNEASGSYKAKRKSVVVPGLMPETEVPYIMDTAKYADGQRYFRSPAEQSIYQAGLASDSADLTELDDISTKQTALKEYNTKVEMASDGLSFDGALRNGAIENEINDAFKNRLVDIITGHVEDRSEAELKELEALRKEDLDYVMAQYVHAATGVEPEIGSTAFLASKEFEDLMALKEDIINEYIGAKKQVNFHNVAIINKFADPETAIAQAFRYLKDEGAQYKHTGVPTMHTKFETSVYDPMTNSQRTNAYVYDSKTGRYAVNNKYKILNVTDPVIQLPDGTYVRQSTFKKYSSQYMHTTSDTRSLIVDALTRSDVPAIGSPEIKQFAEDYAREFNLDEDNTAVLTDVLSKYGSLPLSEIESLPITPGAKRLVDDFIDRKIESLRDSVENVLRKEDKAQVGQLADVDESYLQDIYNSVLTDRGDYTLWGLARSTEDIDASIFKANPELEEYKARIKYRNTVIETAVKKGYLVPTVTEDGVHAYKVVKSFAIPTELKPYIKIQRQLPTGLVKEFNDFVHGENILEQLESEWKSTSKDYHAMITGEALPGEFEVGSPEFKYNLAQKIKNFLYDYADIIDKKGAARTKEFVKDGKTFQYRANDWHDTVNAFHDIQSDITKWNNYVADDKLAEDLHTGLAEDLRQSVSSLQEQMFNPTLQYEFEALEGGLPNYMTSLSGDKLSESVEKAYGKTFKEQFNWEQYYQGSDKKAGDLIISESGFNRLPGNPIQNSVANHITHLESTKVFDKLVGDSKEFDSMKPRAPFEIDYYENPKEFSKAVLSMQPNTMRRWYTLKANGRYEEAKRLLQDTINEYTEYSVVDGVEHRRVTLITESPEAYRFETETQLNRVRRRLGKKVEPITGKWEAVEKARADRYAKRMANTVEATEAETEKILVENAAGEIEAVAPETKVESLPEQAEEQANIDTYSPAKVDATTPEAKFASMNINYQNPELKELDKQITEGIAIQIDNLNDKIKSLQTSNARLLDKVSEAMLDDFDIMQANLGSMQLEDIMKIRQGADQHYMLPKITETLQQIMDACLAEHNGDLVKAKSMFEQVKAHAIRSMVKDQMSTIKGANFAYEMLTRNNTLIFEHNEPRFAETITKLKTAMNQINTKAGHPIFTMEVIPHQPHFTRFALDLKPMNKAMTAEELFKAEQHNREVIDAYTAWYEGEKKTPSEFEDLTFDYRLKESKIERYMAKQKQSYRDLSDTFRSLFIEANTSHADFYKFAGLDGHLEWAAEKFFPERSMNYDFLMPEDKRNSGNWGLIEDQSVTLADKMMRKYGDTGTMSATAYRRSIMGNSYTTNIGIEIMDKESGKIKKVMRPLFTRDAEDAYHNMFTSAFAEHDNLRIARNVMLHPKYQIKNLQIQNLTHDHIATFDILIPQYEGQQLKGFKTIAPTEGNIKMYPSGYLIEKSVSAEVRTLLKHESIVSKSPAYKWMMENIIAPFKRGVLLNLGFPMGNGGDMYYKTLMEEPFENWGKYHKNLAGAYSVIKAHETHLQAYATLRQSLHSAMREVHYMEYLRDMHKYMTDGTKAKWMREAEEHLASRKALAESGTDVVGDLHRAIQYEFYISLPTATTNQKQINLEIGKILRTNKDLEFKKLVDKMMDSKVGTAINKVVKDNTLAKRSAEFNEKLENAMRFAHLSTMVDFEKTGTQLLSDANQTWLANQIIKDAHMQFSEMPGDAVWLSSIFPFWQFPLKNAVWWARFLGKNPALASQTYKLKRELWNGDDDTFWGQMGAVPVSENMVFRGMPGFGSMSQFAMAVDNPTDIMGNRLSPILRPFISKDGNKYKAYSVSDRTPHTDNMLKAWLHGMNPVEGNVQWGLNLVGSQDPIMSRLMPSVFRAQSQSDIAQQQAQQSTPANKGQTDNKQSYSRSNSYSKSSHKSYNKTSH